MLARLEFVGGWPADGGMVQGSSGREMGAASEDKVGAASEDEVGGD